ncbi:MFS transporter [Catenulispora yoronensis]
MTLLFTRPGTGAPARPVPGPRRRLALATLLTSFGNGLYLTISALFFTRTLGFSATRVGVVLTLAGLAGVLASVPAGRAADRYGIKQVSTVLLCGEAVAVAALAFCTTFWAFAAVVCIATALDRGAAAVRQALYARAFDPATRVADRAYIRAVTNAAIGAGAAVAALALQTDSRAVYQGAIVVDAVSFLGMVALLPRLRLREVVEADPEPDLVPAPDSVPDPEPGSDLDSASDLDLGSGSELGSDSGSGSDLGSDSGSGSVSVSVSAAARRPPKVRVSRRYQAVSALNAVLMIQFALGEIGLPLWLLQDTRAPRVLVSGMLIVNTALVVLLQVRAARSVRGIASAARALRLGGLAVAASCVVAACAEGLSPVAATLVLLACGVLMTLGEVLNQAGAWTLSYDLADVRAVGAYQGVFNAGVAAGQMAGPLVVTQTALRHGLAGWVVLGLVFAVAGAAIEPVARRGDGK